MSLQERIARDVKEALKSGDAHRRSVLSMLRSSLHNRAIEEGAQESGLSDEAVIAVISSEAKKRRDAADAYRSAGQEDRAEEEERERAILEEYLPEQLSREEVIKELSAMLADEGDVSMDDLGRLMGAAMQRLKGRVDGNVVREELTTLLKAQ